MNEIVQILQEILAEIRAIRIEIQAGGLKRPRGVAIHCPFHQERTPSCVVDANGFHCFGCRRTGTLAELFKQKAQRKAAA